MRATTQQKGAHTSIERATADGGALDTAAGLVLVYAREHASMPGAVPLIGERFTIGREPERDLPVREAAASRLHACIERRDGVFVLSDVGSTNGTYVNGARITSHRLAEHDLVRVGDTLLRFASRGALGYAAYRLDGRVLEAARTATHGLRTELVGGHQIDLMLDRVDKVARTTLACVIQGESGTGKELVARALHVASGRRGPLAAINCAALPATLIESELFGHKRGAFTGATQDKPGLVRAAHEGTLFLDEVGDMPLEAQAKLLRVLQEREVLPVGANRPEKVDVRVVCATHRDLEREVARGAFRGDLLARLREFSVRVPPLRERREDLFALVAHFARRAGRDVTDVSPAALIALAHHDWPYNVRELESAVKLAVALADGGKIEPRHLPESIARPGQAAPKAVAASVAASTAEGDDDVGSPARGGAPTEAALRALLAAHGGNVAAVGRALGKERMQIHRWLKRYRIDLGAYRP